ncbi:DUF2164 domain-containing protein [soil metagenome]
MKMEFSREQKAEIVASLQRYFTEELDFELRDMPAGFLVDYILKEIGPFAYNKGVEDAREYFASKVEDLTGVCFEEGLTYWKEAKGEGRWVRRKAGG